MQKYKLEGFYLYANAPNGKGNLTGELELSENGQFESEIIDHASVSPKQLIKGHLREEQGLDKLIFMKCPPKMNLANLAYELNKKSNGSFEGKYEGNWAALPVKISYMEEYSLFITQIDMSMCLLKDKAEINLFKK